MLNAVTLIPPFLMIPIRFSCCRQFIWKLFNFISSLFLQTEHSTCKLVIFFPTRDGDGGRGVFARIFRQCYLQTMLCDERVAMDGERHVELGAHSTVIWRIFTSVNERKFLLVSAFSKIKRRRRLLYKMKEVEQKFAFYMLRNWMRK